MKIYGVENTIASAEAIGFGKVFEAYGENCAGEDILEIGFNANTGYVYIALEIGISICSGFGNDVEYIVVDPEDGEETFFDDYELALDQLEAYNPPYDEY